MLVLGLAQVEGELVVDGEVVVAALVDWVTKIMILNITFLTVVSSHPLHVHINSIFQANKIIYLGSAETVTCVMITTGALSIALTPEGNRTLVYIISQSFLNQD